MGLLSVFFKAYGNSTLDTVNTYNETIRQERSKSQKNSSIVTSALTKAHDVLLGHAASIGHKSADVHERLIMFETLIHEQHIHPTGPNLFEEKLSKPHMAHEINHFFAMALMKNVIRQLCVDSKNMSSYEAILNYASTCTETLRSDTLHSIFYTPKHLRLLFPYEIIKRFISLHDFSDVSKQEKDQLGYLLMSWYRDIEKKDPVALVIIMDDLPSFGREMIENFLLSSQHIPNFEEDATIEEHNRQSKTHKKSYKKINTRKKMSQRSRSKGESGSPTPSYSSSFHRAHNHSMRRAKFLENASHIERIRKELERIAMDTNVHSITTTLVRNNYQHLKSFYVNYVSKKLNLNQTIMSFDDVSSIFNDFIRSSSQEIQSRQGSFNHTMALIKGYYHNPVDNETLISLPEIMSYVVNLAVLHDDLGFVFDCIAENHEQGGGCHPGVTGRLFIKLLCLLYPHAK